MKNEWALDNRELKLDPDEREALLYLYESDTPDMAETSDIEAGCPSIGYSRQALRVINSLEDVGLVTSRLGEDDHPSARNPPRIAMLTSRAETFISGHEAELATADMDYDDLRETVYTLETEVEALEDELEEHRDEVDAELGELNRDGIANVRADLQQLEDRLDEVEAAVEERATKRQVNAVRRDIDSDLDAVRGEVGDRINGVAAHVGTLETEVDLLNESVEDLEEWTASTSEWIEETLIPSMQRVEPVVKWFESRQRESTDREDIDDFGAVEGVWRRLFSQ